MLLRFASRNEDLLLAVAEVRGVAVRPSSPAQVERLEQRARSLRNEGDHPPPLRAGVRDLLRAGGFRPTGRSKPASEYLAQAGIKGQIPIVNNLVDAMNFESLDRGFPVSLLDLDRALGDAEALEVREGHDGESFVFNAAGQTIDVSGLVSIARIGGPALANPVKDSMASKITMETKNVMAVLYASRRLVPPDLVEGWAVEMCGNLIRSGGATSWESYALP